MVSITFHLYSYLGRQVKWKFGLRSSKSYFIVSKKGQELLFWVYIEGVNFSLCFNLFISLQMSSLVVQRNTVSNSSKGHFHILDNSEDSFKYPTYLERLHHTFKLMYLHVVPLLLVSNCDQSRVQQLSISQPKEGSLYHCSSFKNTPEICKEWCFCQSNNSS